MIEYVFKLKDDKQLAFSIDLERQASVQGEDQPAWTALEFHQCPTCPLAKKSYPRCPVAVDVTKIIGDFSELLSYDQVEVIVSTSDREIRKTCDVQTGLKSLMGVVMGSSHCPVLSGFRGMANFHLPFASLEETIVRSVSFYLLKRLFDSWDGKAADFSLDGLKYLYLEAEAVNTAFLERIRAAVKLDANLNAVLNLYADSNIVKTDLEEILQEIKPMITGSAS